MASSGGITQQLALLASLLLAIVLLWIPLQQQSGQIDHYKVLGVRRNAGNEEIEAAFMQLKASQEQDYDKMQMGEHAFYVLSDATRRRDYDHFGLDSEQPEEVNQNVPSGPIPSLTTSLNIKNFKFVLESSKPWLIQLYSVGNRKSRDFAHVWERIAGVLEGQVNLGRVELGEVELARLLTKRNWVKASHFPYGIPAIVAVPSECKRLDCVVRYTKELTYESLLDWIATRFLDLPRILYYTSQSLIPEFLQKSGLHKVKVIFFSDTGERAYPYMREAAKNYSEYAAFGCVLWRQEEAFLWKSRLGVESAPAIVFLKEPGVQPVIVHGKMNRTMLNQLLEEHKYHVLPQLRSITASSLGCDITGYSVAGMDVLTWYCLITAGKPGYRLDQLRGTMRLVQDELESMEEEDSVAAATAYREKRLTLSWLDGAVQKKFCYYFLASETVHETCGPKQYAEEEDVPRIFMIRFRRAPGKQQNQRPNNNFWQQLYTHQEEEDLASILVARYNGADEVSEILTWISDTVRDGDTEEIPFFKTTTAPVLVPEASPPMLSAARSRVTAKARDVTETGSQLISDMLGLLKDARLVTILVLVVTIYAMGCSMKQKRKSRQDWQSRIDPPSAGTQIESPNITKAEQSGSGNVPEVEKKNKD